MIFYPSEVARLVLGYLNECGCWFSAEIFLTESSHLEEHRKLVKTGKFHSLNVNGKTLVELLDVLDCEEDLRGSKENCHLSGSSKRIVHVGVQTESLSLAHDGEGVQIAADESSGEESVHEVLLSPKEEYVICPFEATSPESFIEQSSVFALKITDSFIVSDELFDRQTFPNINSQNSVAAKRRKSFPPRKLLVDSLVCKKLDKYERCCTPDLLQKDMVFLDQLLCDHPVVQKIVYAINRVKEKELREDKNLPPSNKNSMYIEEIVRETVAEIASNIFLHKYFDFLCYQRDSYMSFRKSRRLNFDEHEEKLSTVSSKAHKTSCLNLEEYVAEDSTVMSPEIIPDTISAIEDVVNPHLKNIYSNKAKADNLSAIENITLDDLSVANTDESTFADDDSSDIQNSAYETSDGNKKSTSKDMNEILSDDQSDGHSLSVHSQQKISNIIVEENATSESEVMMPVELLEKQNSGWKQSQPIPEKADNIQPANIQSSTLMDLSLNVTNVDESISVVHDSSNVQNSTNETSGVPSQLDANKKSTLNSMNEILSDDQSGGHSLSIHSHQNISDIIMKENTTSKSEVMMSAELLEKQNSRQLIAEKVDNIQPADIQSSTLMDLSLNVTNVDESISDIIMEENTTSKSEVMMPALLKKQNSRQLIPEKVDNIQPADIQSSTLMDLSLNVTNVEESISAVHDSSDIQNYANEIAFSSELGVNPSNISNSMNEILPDDQTDGITLPVHFQQKISDIIMKEIINTTSESEVMMPSELLNAQKSLLISEESGNVRPPNFSNSTSRYAPVMSVFQNNDFSQPSNSFITPQFPSACLNSIFMSSTSNMYFIQDNFIYQVIMGPNVNSASSLNSNLFEASSGINNWTRSILDLPAPTSNINSLASSYDGLLTVSSNCSMLPTSSVLSSFSNNSIVPTFSSNFSTGVLRNAQPASLSNASQTVSNNVLPVPLNGINLPAPLGKNYFPLLTNIVNVPLCSTTQLNTNSFHIPSVDNGNITQIPINSPHVTSIVGTLQDVELVIADDSENTEKESTRSLPDFEKPIVSEAKKKSMKAEGKNKGKKGNNKRLPKNNHETLSSSEICLKKKQHCQRLTRKIVRHPLFPFNPNLENYAIVGLLEPVLPSNEPNLSTSSNQECPVVPNVTKNPSSEEENVNGRTRLLCSSKTYLGCRTSTSNFIVRNNCSENGPHCIQFDSESNNSILKNTNPVCMTSEPYKKRLVISDILNCTNSDVNAGNDKMTLPLVRCLDSTTLNSTYSGADSAHDEITIPTRCLTSSSSPIGTNSYVDVADDEITNLECVANSNISNSINSDVVITNDQTTTFLESYANLPIPNGMNSDIDEAGDQTTVSLSSSKDCAHFSNTTFDYVINHEIDEEDIPLSELKNQKCLEQSSHLKVSSNRVYAEVSNAASDSAGNEEDILYEFQYRKAHERKSFKKSQESSGSKKARGKSAHTRSHESCFTSDEFSQSSNILEDNCNSAKGANKSHFSNTTFYYMINHEIDEEDIPLSEFKNQKCPEQSSHLKVSSNRVYAEVSNAAPDNAENEEDILYEFQYRKAHERKSFKKIQESSGSKKARGKFAHTRSHESCFTSEEFSQSSNILEDNCNSAKGANKSEDAPVSPSYSSILNSLLFSLTKKCTNQKIPLQVKNVCAISSVPEHLSSSSDGSYAEAGNLSLCSSVISSLEDAPKLQNNINPVSSDAFQSNDLSVETLDNKHIFLSQTDNGCFKKTNGNHPVSRKCENIGDLDQNIRLSKSKRKKNSSKEASKGKLSKMSLEQEEETSHSDLANLRSDDKLSKEISSNFPVELENLCAISSSLPAHLISSCGETLEAGDSSVFLLPKDPTKERNSLNSFATESLQSDDSSTEALDNICGLLSQTDNGFFKQRNHNHSVSRKSENIDNLHQNIRSSKTKQRRSSSKEILKRKLWKNFTKQKEETSHPDLINIKTDNKPSVEMSFNFPVGVENLCKISSSLPEHLSSSCKNLEAGDPSVSLLDISSPKDASKFQNNIDPLSSDAFQNNGSFVETLDNKQALCFKQANDNHAVLRKCETIGDSYQNIKSSEIKRRKNSSNETLKRKLPKRFAKQTETSHSDLSNLKTNDKTSLEVSNFLAETENLHAIPSLPEHLSPCVETKAVTNNSSPMPLLLKDGAQFQNTLHQTTAESFESNNSPPERLANTNAFLDLPDNSCFKQTNDGHTISKKSDTISNLDQNIKSSKRKRRKNSSKGTSKGRSPKKFTKQKKKSSYSELANPKTNEKCRVENPFDFSVEMENLHSIPSLHAHSSSLCSETQVEIKNSSTYLLPKAPTELQNSLIPVTSDPFLNDDSSAETLDNIRAFLSSTDIKDNYDISRECKEAISNKVENQNIGSSEIKVLRRHSIKQSNPKKVASLKQIKHKLKKKSKKETNRKCKVKETNNSTMQKTYQSPSLKAFTSRCNTKKNNGIKETLEEDFLKCIAPKNENLTGYALDIKKSQKMCKAKKQNGRKLGSKKQKSVKAKLYKSSKESLCSKQKINTKSFDNINDLIDLNSVSDQNLDLDEKHKMTTSLDKRVTLGMTHKEMVLIPMKKRIVFDYLKCEYLESFYNFFQKMFLLIRYAKEIDQFYFEIKKILLFKFISQKDQNDDLLAKYLDGKLLIKNLKTNSALLKSALNSEDSDKSPSIDIFKRLCCKTSTIQQKFERRFKFGMKMYHEKMQIKKNDIIKYVDLHLLYLELHSIMESLIKKSSISKEKVYSFEDPGFSLGSELFSQQPIVLLERLNIPSLVRNIIDGTESQSCERNSKNFKQTVSIKNLVSSSPNESQKPFLATLLNVRGSALKKPSGLTIMSSLISFNGGNVWPDEFKNKIINIFEITMETALFVNNILYNICEYSCDISKLVLGNNFLHQNMSHSLLVDSSEKKGNSLSEFPPLDETIVSPAEDLTNENDIGQCHSPPKRQRVSLEDFSFAEQISKALGGLKDSTVDNSQNSHRTHDNSDLQNEISSLCIVKSEATKKSCKSMEKSDFYPQQDSGHIRNKSAVHKRTFKNLKQNNKEVADLKITRKLKRSNKLNPSKLKKQQDSKVTKKKNLNSFRKSCRKLLLNSLPDAHILSEAKKLEIYAPPMNADKECCLSSREAVDSESFSTMSESFISDSLTDSSSNTFIYWPTSTDQENLGFKIKESINPKELHTKSKGICAASKESTEQTKIWENSISEITCINLDEGECNFNDKIHVSSIDDKSEKQALNSCKENGNRCVTPELAEIGSETNIDVLNCTTEADHSQNISQKPCILSSKKSKSKKKIASLHKNSLKKKKPTSVLKSKSQGSPTESSSSLLPQMEEVDASSTSTSASNLSLSILFNTDEFLAALGEKSVTEKKKKSAEIVMNSILKMGIEGFTKLLPPVT
ncbi:hypothetical protein AVEN_34932-1 [Araneus ventricosus]|uniref:Uncharacterized protein n=1 Tax=Araneus ventricosus TaxID=182803 RepID=A0A4Y2GB83_ARAVE|nr:hypothetical protein AVEN_34932-1 [Araneus ventricosus]